MSTKYTFQTEVRELLDIVINALYSDREIFIREVVSNASDALEKLRLKQLTDSEGVEGSGSLEISLKTDEEKQTVTITDTGIGMTEEELVENLGTIAHSGTKKFLQAMKESHGGADVIGQFGVGFYSSFMVADKVTVTTRSALKGSVGKTWESNGIDGYEITEAPEAPIGTSLEIHLKDEYKEYARAERVRGVLNRYSAFVGFPVLLNGERINTVEAIWLKGKNELKQEDYDAFYKYIAHTEEAALTHMHFSTDAPIDLHALIFVPKENTEVIGFGRMEPGVALHCRKVLIDAKPEGLLPEWLRFLKGVIDSEDLPLNISREMLQDNGLIRKINDIITKRFLKHLENLASKEADVYEEFYKTFSRFLKEGVITSWAYKDQLGKLLRFESTFTEPGKMTSFADYVSRMKEEQKEIYVLSGPNRTQLENSPYLEAFKARGLEVAFLTDNGDEFVIEALHSFGENPVVAIDRADVKLSDLEQTGESLNEEDSKGLQSWLTETLGKTFDKISLSGERMVDSPAIVTQSPDAPSVEVREYLKAVGQQIPDVKPHLELNPRHELVKSLATLRETNPDLATLMARQLADSALLTAGLLEDPTSLTKNTEALLTQLAHLQNEKSK